MEFPKKESLKLIKIALEEDLGKGDITSNIVIPAAAFCEAKIISKSGGVLCGTDAVVQVYSAISKSIKIRPIKKDGVRYSKKDCITEIKGSARDILAGERVALNFLCHLSGISTQTARFVDALAGTNCKILDTRKTTPGMRALEKYAVTIGGGTNHRFGLWDMIMIKDNHIAIAGGVREALETVYAKGKPEKPVVIEVKDLDELKIALSYPVDRILLDNFPVSDVEKAIGIRREIGKNIMFEVSGGITLENARSYAKTGVEFLSSGALTHSVRAADFSLEIEEKND